MTNSQILREAKALIADKEHWTVLLYRRPTETGLQYCAWGALQEVCQASFAHPTQRYLQTAAQDIYGGDGRYAVVHVNDVLGHAAVMDIYDRAIKMAEMDEWTP